jgi:hypothetical protein
MVKTALIKPPFLTPPPLPTRLLILVHAFFLKLGALLYKRHHTDRCSRGPVPRLLSRLLLKIQNTYERTVFANVLCIFYYGSNIYRHYASALKFKDGTLCY